MPYNAYMLPTSHRIIDPAAGSRPLAAWLSGVAVAMLTVGFYGALQPLLPPPQALFRGGDDTIQASEFMAPNEPPSDSPDDATKIQPEQNIEIPPIPDVTPPITPPEVPELVPMDTPPPPPSPKRPELKPKPKAEPKTSAQRSTPSRSAPGAGTSKPGGGGSGSSPTLFSGSGGGSFPKGPYPSAARSLRQQGTVRLSVTVEASGLPSSVDVTGSSGFGSLDSAAQDQVRRHWRWPAGSVRRFIVPFRYELH